jgi:hypothetical protein
MSHVVSIQTLFRDPVAIAAACQRLGLATPVHGTAQLYSGTITGLLIHLPGWEYPIAIDPATGTVQADDFNGAWGDRAELGRLTQAYAIERVHMESRKKALRVTETPLEDGSIKLVLEGV